MTEHDPKQIIIDELCYLRRTSSWIGSAVKETIHFLREYTLSDRQVHILTFEDTNGQMFDSMYVIGQDKSGAWQMNGGSTARHEGSLRKKPTYSSPWVRISGGGWGDCF